jgi:hypothetical protein
MKYFILIVLSLVSFSAFAQQFTDPSASDWMALSTQIHGLLGLGLFGIAFLIVQVLFLLFRTSVGQVLGVYQLLVLSALSVLVTIGAKIVTGQPLISVLTDGPTLIAYQVLINQVMKQWKKMGTDAASLKSSSNP